jgi:hypothetical protein
MWIICPQSFTESPSARVGADSISASDWRFQLLARSAGLSGKPMPQTTWHRKWKRASWLGHLFGLICEPSMASRGVDAWITSLRDIRANRLASAVIVVDGMILDTCGRMSVASLAKVNSPSVFSRTFKGTRHLDSTVFAATFTAWVAKWRSVSSQRQKSVFRTFAPGCSSSQYRRDFYPTPTASDSHSPNCGQHHVERKGLKSLRLNHFCWVLGRRDLARSMNFRQWLMGWPLTSTGSICSATEWCRYKLRMRSALSGLLSAFDKEEE